MSPEQHIKINEYQGFRLGAAGASSGKGGSIPVERVEDLDPPTFWAKYVSQRKPVGAERGGRGGQGPG